MKEAGTPNDTMSLEQARAIAKKLDNDHRQELSMGLLSIYNNYKNDKGTKMNNDVLQKKLAELGEELIDEYGGHSDMEVRNNAESNWLGNSVVLGNPYHYICQENGRPNSMTISDKVAYDKVYVGRNSKGEIRIEASIGKVTISISVDKKGHQIRVCHDSNNLLNFSSTEFTIKTLHEFLGLIKKYLSQRNIDDNSLKTRKIQRDTSDRVKALLKIRERGIETAPAYFTQGNPVHPNNNTSEGYYNSIGDYPGVLGF